MKRLNGWMRLRVIASVVWMVGGAITVGTSISNERNAKHQ